MIWLMDLDLLAAPTDVSIVVPTFRREREVVEAIWSGLAQQGVSVEVIVLDDSPEGSARDAVAAIVDPRVSYLKCPAPSGGKPAVVRNAGARLAKGCYLHFLDDDDQLLPGSLAALVAALKANPTVGVAVGKVVPFGLDGKALQTNSAW